MRGMIIVVSAVLAAAAGVGASAPVTQAHCTVNVGSCSGHCYINAGTCGSNDNCTVNVGYCNDTRLLGIL